MSASDIHRKAMLESVRKEKRLFLGNLCAVVVIAVYHIFVFLNHQSEHKVLYELMCWLSGSLTCRLPNVMRSPLARRSLVSSITIDWCLAPRRWGFYLKSKSTNLPGPWSPRWSSPHKENSHGRAGNRNRDLLISCPKLWPLDHEAGRLSHIT